MQLTIRISEEEESRLRSAAMPGDASLEDAVHRLLSKPLGQQRSADRTLALLERWKQEDESCDPEELARRRGEWQEIGKALQDEDLSFRTPEIAGP